MKRLLLVCVTVLLLICAVAAQEPEPAPATKPVTAAPAQASTPASTPTTQKTVAPSETAMPAKKPEPEQRWFFPKNNWIYGYAEFDIAPPHNELDPNLCAANAGDYGGANSQCNAFARYVMLGQVEIRPFGRTFLQRLKFFGTPTFVFGKTVPQYLYTWSMDPIGWQRQWGAAFYLGRRFDLRVTQQFLFQRMGARDQYLGPAYLGPNGPWGRFTMIGVRKYFGSPQVHDEAAR